MMTDAIKSMTDAALCFAAADLQSAIAAQESMVRAGNVAPKLGQYWDELFAVRAELNRRRAGA